MSREIVYGPYARQRADGKWEMTEEGQQILLEWMKEWPEPARLLNKTHRWHYNAWMRMHWRQNKGRWRYDAVNQMCLAACCRAMLTYDGSVKFTTYAASAMFFECRREIEENDRFTGKSKDVRIVSGYAMASGTDCTLFDEIEGGGIDPRDQIDGEENFLAMVEEASRQLPPGESYRQKCRMTAKERKRVDDMRQQTKERWKYVFLSHFHDGESQSALAREMKVTRSCVAQIVTRGCEKIRQAMADDLL